MQKPDFIRDGWRLDDGEEMHAEAPATFYLPELAERKTLQIGDYAKLVFEIAVEGDEHPNVERMWVLIREITPDGYIGILSNEPTCIGKNDVLWHGTILPFEYRHIINIQPGDEESRTIAKAPPPHLGPIN